MNNPDKLWQDPVFAVGQTIKCVHPADYHHLTVSKEYTVRSYEPRKPVENYVWPAYVDVVDDCGREIGCHAIRFEAVDANEHP